ncbi:exonuclease subunit SbcC [Bacillus capparidis]|uniref:Nuclease SbcCD subunit C n=1 Tax=Bacillus capparidis TaxID=1840411 RepID=A0ABS4CPU9_9BACI|nr:exonuclease subunit SbcC [Bacillus capparidis]MBP1079567.1 exonuclease SbcC [Bacillus capparidis]MED1094968.1 SMC family ATPase [Bacillus capparidis]
MKPIKLAIKGLHSFREEQLIDFDRLCGSGVFGIFGPTGSGKSSILDAMTLALYGKVERASNNTHGILNHAEDQLSVSFTFTLQSSSEISYKVERVFKRVDDTKVKTSLCRLIEIASEQTVIADKASEVNRQVESLLGLTIDDFTRAVVLPQGKFAEFLSLKGADRRQMLQRLFNLEQYGDRFMQALRTRAAEAQSEKNEMMAELTGLGDASSEKLELAETNLAQAEENLLKRKLEREEAAAHHLKTQELWVLQKDRDSYLAEQKKLHENQKNIESKKEKLALSQTAEALKPYADASLDSQKKCDEASKRMQEAERIYEKRKKEYTGSQQEEEAFFSYKRKTEPELLQKREKLVHAIQVEQALSEEKQKEKTLETARQQKDKEISEMQAQLEKETSLFDRAQKKQNDLKNELTSYAVSSEERKQCQEAGQFAYQMDRITEQYDQELKRKLEADEAIKKTQRFADEASKNKKSLEENIQQAFGTLLELYEITCDSERTLTHTVHEAQHQLRQLSERREEAKMEAFADELRKKLKDGEACPVCGSIHHDQRLEHHAASSDYPFEEEMAGLEKVISSAKPLSDEFLSTKIKLEEQADYLLREAPFVKNTESNAQEAAAAMERAPSLEQLEEMEWDWRKLKQDIQESKDKTARLLKKYKETAKKEEQLLEKLEFEAKESERIGNQASELKASIDQAHSEFSGRFKGIEVSKAAEWQKAIDEKDKASEALSKRIETSVTFLQEKEETRTQRSDRIQLLEREKWDVHYSLEHLQKSIAEKQQKLSAFSQATGLQQQLDNVSAELDHITEKERKLTEQKSSLLGGLTQSEADYKSSQSFLEDARKGKLKAEEAWKEKTAGTPFSDWQEINEHLLSHEDMSILKKEVEAFEDQVKQCNANLKRVEGLLQGRCLTEDEWKKTVDAKKEADDAYDSAMEERGAFHKILIELKVRHERYSTLENQLNKLQVDIDRLSKLQTVFKGNSFVEFLAEKQLESVSRDASARLSNLTRQRYAIEVDSEGGFVMRDDANGGFKRPVSSLSGGETFLTSLALALSLSAQIQLRGEYPLQFFFLDEGFGTLDQELLDTVISALEKLQSDNLSVGVISHVQELRERLHRKLVVHPSEPGGKGTAVVIEIS